MVVVIVLGFGPGGLLTIFHFCFFVIRDWGTPLNQKRDGDWRQHQIDHPLTGFTRKKGYPAYVCWGRCRPETGDNFRHS